MKSFESVHPGSTTVFQSFDILQFVQLLNYRSFPFLLKQEQTVRPFFSAAAAGTDSSMLIGRGSLLTCAGGSL